MGGPSCRKGESPVTSTSAARVIQTASLLAHASPSWITGTRPQWGQQPSSHGTPWRCPPFPLRPALQLLAADHVPHTPQPGARPVLPRGGHRTSTSRSGPPECQPVTPQGKRDTPVLHTRVSPGARGSTWPAPWWGDVTTGLAAEPGDPGSRLLHPLVAEVTLGRSVPPLKLSSLICKRKAAWIQ